MAINLWRYVEYTDDGCALFQCLQCYERWEMRGSPGYFYEGEYRPCWKFCPCCGTKWDGMRGEHITGCDKPLGPRRMRIHEAEQRWRNAAMDRYWTQPNRSPFWPGQYVPPFFWQVEVRQSSHYFGRTIEQEPWKVHNWIKGMSMPVPAVLAHARFLQKQLQANVAGRESYDMEGEITHDEWTTQVRVTVTRTAPNSGYEIDRVLKT